MTNISGVFGTNIFTVKSTSATGTSASTNTSGSASSTSNNKTDSLSLSKSLSQTLADQGYTLVNGYKYTKDGQTYYWNNSACKMETKDQRIDSCLDMIQNYLSDLHKKMPNNSYVTKLYNLITNNKNQIKKDLNVDGATVDLPGFGEVGGFGGFGKMTMPKDEFENTSMVGLSSSILHEMVHYSDNDNVTSKTEEMDAYALEMGLQKYYWGSSTWSPSETVDNVNKLYSVDLKEASGHELNDPALDQLRSYLGYGEDVQNKLKDDNILNSFTGGFINGGGTVLGAGISIGGSIGKALGSEKAGRIIGGVVAAIPAIVTGVAVGVAKAITNVAKKVANSCKKFFKSLKFW